MEQPQESETTNIVKQEQSKQDLSDHGLSFYDGYTVNPALGPEYYPGQQQQYMSAAQYVAAQSYSSALNYGYHHAVAAGPAGHTHQHSK